MLLYISQKIFKKYLYCWSYSKFTWDVSSKAQSVQQQATGWAPGVLFLVGARDLCLLHSIPTGSDAHPASSSAATRCSFLGCKEAWV
jgi:hypothetical protein